MASTVFLDSIIRFDNSIQMRNGYDGPFLLAALDKEKLFGNPSLIFRSITLYATVQMESRKPSRQIEQRRDNDHEYGRGATLYMSNRGRTKTRCSGLQTIIQRTYTGATKGKSRTERNGTGI